MKKKKEFWKFFFTSNLGCNAYHSFIFQTRTSEEITQQAKTWNNDFKELRIIIENVIGEIKKYKIATDKFKTKIASLNEALEEHQKIWIVCGGLVKLFGSPLRNW